MKYRIVENQDGFKIQMRCNVLVFFYWQDFHILYLGSGLPPTLYFKTLEKATEALTAYIKQERSKIKKIHNFSIDENIGDDEVVK